MKLKINKGYFFLIVVWLICAGCGVYSFNQGSIGPDVKTISIANFYNESGNGPPNLGQTFTEQLKSYYQENSRLGIVKDNGDWQLEGRINGWSLAPVAPQENQTSAFTRLTINVQVKFTNTKDEKASFDQGFSWYSDFSSGESPQAVEGRLIQDIFEKIVFNIFNKTTSNW